MLELKYPIAAHKLKLLVFQWVTGSRGSVTDVKTKFYLHVAFKTFDKLQLL